MPLEFSRIAADGRLTLAIDPAHGTWCRTYWAESSYRGLDLAKANLENREECASTHVHSMETTDNPNVAANDPVRNSIKEWLNSKAPIGAAVWTGLPSNWHEPAKRNREYSVDDALAYVAESMNEKGESDPEFKRLKEYIRNAPRQTDTEARRRILRWAGWKQAELSEILFEHS